MKNLLKFRNVRRVAQMFFFTLFLFFVFVTDLRYLKGYHVSLFIELDPLVSFATAITTHTVYMGLMWSLLLILPTLLFGRIFCNWICPYGILHHFTGWLFCQGRAPERERIEANRKFFRLHQLGAAHIDHRDRHGGVRSGTGHAASGGRPAPIARETVTTGDRSG